MSKKKNNKKEETKVTTETANVHEREVDTSATEEVINEEPTSEETQESDSSEETQESDSSEETQESDSSEETQESDSSEEAETVEEVAAPKKDEPKRELSRKEAEAQAKTAHEDHLIALILKEVFDLDSGKQHSIQELLAYGRQAKAVMSKEDLEEIESM